MRWVDDSYQQLGLKRVGVLLTYDLDIFTHGSQFQVDAYLNQLLTGGWRALAELRSSGVVGAETAARYPGVREAAVIAMPPPRWQERPFLIVVTDDDARVSPEALRAHLLDNVPKWWLLDAIVFAKELPHGPTGKLQKDVLRRHVADGTVVPNGC